MTSATKRRRCSLTRRRPSTYAVWFPSRSGHDRRTSRPRPAAVAGGPGRHAALQGAPDVQRAGVCPGQALKTATAAGTPTAQPATRPPLTSRVRPGLTGRVRPGLTGRGRDNVSPTNRCERVGCAVHLSPRSLGRGLDLCPLRTDYMLCVSLIVVREGGGYLCNPTESIVGWAAVSVRVCQRLSGQPPRPTTPPRQHPYRGRPVPAHPLRLWTQQPERL
jgi:hypothetical protein